MIYVKIHKSSGSFVTSVCDSELIGKKFKENKIILNVVESFYKGEEFDVKKVKEFMLKAINLNIVGQKSINIALELNLISKDHILIVKGVPHAQCIIL